MCKEVKTHRSRHEAKTNGWEGVRIDFSPPRLSGSAFLERVLYSSKRPLQD